MPNRYPHLYPADGATYHAPADSDRLKRQRDAILAYLARDHEWHTVSEIRHALKLGEEAAITSRIRDLRKQKFGGYDVPGRPKPGTPPRSGIWEYRLAPATERPVPLTPQASLLEFA